MIDSSIAMTKPIASSQEIEPPPGNFVPEASSGMEETHAQWMSSVDFTHTTEDRDSFDELLNQPLPPGDIKPAIIVPPPVVPPSIVAK